jgi:hypothetical protein
MSWDVRKAIQYLQSHAEPHSTGRCAHHVREAIEAGGVHLIHHVSAKDYGSSLLVVGFQEIPWEVVNMECAGDVGIVEPITGHPHGHMAMFDGTYWISDFVQLHGLYPGKSYRAAMPPFAIYRHPAA